MPCDILDCLKSARARDSVRSIPEVQAFSEQWSQNLGHVLSLGDDPAFLLLKYADLVAEPARCLERITAFAGVEGMKPEDLYLMRTEGTDISFRSPSINHVKTRLSGFSTWKVITASIMPDFGFGTVLTHRLPTSLQRMKLSRKCLVAPQRTRRLRSWASRDLRLNGFRLQNCATSPR